MSYRNIVQAEIALRLIEAAEGQLRLATQSESWHLGGPANESAKEGFEVAECLLYDALESLRAATPGSKHPWKARD